jgi:periplasmic protein CpxP/Spy
MKKNILIALSLVLFVSAQSFAQANAPEKPVKTGNEWKMPSDVFKRSQDFADNLKKTLGLNTEQTKKVYEAFLNNTKPVDEIMIGITDKKEQAAALKANQEAFKTTLKDILSPEQFSKYVKMGVKKSKNKAR